MQPLLAMMRSGRSCSDSLGTDSTARLEEGNGHMSFSANREAPLGIATVRVTGYDHSIVSVSL